jgi:hypothetical protein
MKAVLGGVLAASLLVSPAFAQSSSSAWNGLSDRFQIDTGYFRISAHTVLRYNGAQGSGDIDFENDLGVGENADTFWLDATWRVGMRHKLKLAYTKLDPSGATTRCSATSAGAARPTTPGSRRPRRPGATSSAATTASPSSATTATRSARRSASATSG